MSYIGVTIAWLVLYFRRRLLINPEEHPMLIAEPSTNSGQQREKYVYMFFVNMYITDPWFYGKTYLQA
jgi:actin-related protein